MFLQGKSEKGSRFAVRLDRISAVREKGSMSWACVDGQWLAIDMPYAALVETWDRAVSASAQKAE